jgi:2-methylisocitrate lyase-like PEP mutase family enzyme
MKTQEQKAHRFRKLHVNGEPLVLFNIWDPGSAKAVAKVGAKALATSSWAVSEACGYSNGEHTPLNLAIDNLRRITDATDLPVTVDLESGYGDTPEKVGETVALAINAGAIGCNLEDSFPENGLLREIAHKVERLRQARKAADRTDVSFFINARTDVFLQASQKKARRVTACSYPGAGTCLCRCGRRRSICARPERFGIDRRINEGVTFAGQYYGGRRRRYRSTRETRRLSRELWCGPLRQSDERLSRGGS